MKKTIMMRLRFFLSVILLVLCIGGCGKEKTQETMAEEDAIVGEPEQGVPETGESDEGTPESTETGENSQKEEEPVQDIEIDEETKEELTTQLLEENELDTSIVDNVQTTRGCTFTLPEGFTEVEDMPGMYVTKRYPIDASNIYYVEMDKDISLQLMTEETFLAQMQNNFEQIYGEDIAIDLKSYEKIEIDGYPAFKILCSYTVDGIEITQLEYTINADKSYVITYSQTHEYDRMEEFEASAATIHVEVSK